MQIIPDNQSINQSIIKREPCTDWRSCRRNSQH